MRVAAQGELVRGKGDNAGGSQRGREVRRGNFTGAQEGEKGNNFD